MDMPAIIQDAFSSGFSLPSAASAVPDMTQTVATIKEVWDAQTFSDLVSGQVHVPDDVINQALASMLESGGPVTEMKVTSLKNHQLRIEAKTAKEGRVVLVCTVEQLVHNQDQSLLTLKVTDKKLPDKPFVSWIFSRVSLAMVSKVVGHLDPSYGLDVNIHGNTVTIDFRQALYNSRLGNLELFGYRPVDYLTVYSLTPQDGFSDISTNLALPEQIKTMIKNVWL